MEYYGHVAGFSQRPWHRDVEPVSLTPSIAALVVVDGDGAASWGGGEWHRQRRSLHIAASVDEVLQQRETLIGESS